MFQVGEGGIIMHLELFDVRYANLASVEANQRSTAVVRFSLLESMGRFGTLIHLSLQIGVFYKFVNLFLYIHSKIVKNEKNIDMEYNSCYILYIEL